MIGPLVLVLAGCQLASMNTWHYSDDAAMPSPRATYNKGTATIDVGGVSSHPIALDRVSRGPHVFTLIGTNVTWRGDNGWALRVSTYDDLGFGPGRPSGEVELHLIANGEHMATMDPSRCVVTIDESTDTRLSGKATCRGLSWTDMLEDPPFGLYPSASPGETFDAEITFEAEQ